MASQLPARRRRGVLIAGSLMVTALTAATAVASVPTPMGVAAPERTQLGAAPRPRTPVPAFLLDRGRATKFDHPDAATETAAGSINNRGQIVGAYVDAGIGYHGLVRNEAGKFTSLNIPGAKGTGPYRINDRGQILGAYADNDGTLHNFLLDLGSFTSFDAPGGVVTWARDLNNRGQIAGFTLAPTEEDPLAGARGFLLAKGVKGPFTPIDVPGAPRNLVFGLNDRGQLVGAYENTDAASSPPSSARGPR